VTAGLAATAGLAGLAALLTLGAAPATARAQSITITVLGVSGRDLDERPITSPVLFSKADCDAGATVTLRIANIPTAGVTVLDVWTGTGCNNVEPRTSTTSSACQHRFALTSFLPPMQEFSVPLSMFGGCATGGDGTNVSVYFLGATREMTPEAVTAFGVLETTFDTVPPGAPTEVTAGSGDSAVPVSWTRSTGTIQSYAVYARRGGGGGGADGGSCGGLTAGMAPPADAVRVATTSGDAASATINLGALGVAVGESVAVGVVARDRALNESVLSNVACATRIETCGYLCGRGGEVGSCSVGGAPGRGGAGSRGGTGGLAGLGALLGLIALARAAGGGRRRRAGRRGLGRAAAPPRLAVFALALAAGLGGAWAANALWPGAARAQALEEWSEPTNPASPERFAVEFRFGSYRPDTGDEAFTRYFGEGGSFLAAFEFDYLPLRLPNLLSFGVGAGIGLTSFSGKAVDASGRATDEETSLSLVPMNLVAVLRVVALPRLLGIPFTFAGKLGLDMVHWSASTGDNDDGSGLSTGLRWAVQAALELDFFEPRAARALDEEWGINHTMLFFELYGSTAEGGSLPVGTGLSWAAGLGLLF
jgi:hypothetical protein